MAETEAVIDRLIEDIDHARNHVHLLFYIFWDDDTGIRVVDALARAVKRGVRCRVLIDDVGSRKTMRSLTYKMQCAGYRCLLHVACRYLSASCGAI